MKIPEQKDMLTSRGKHCMFMIHVFVHHRTRQEINVWIVDKLIWLVSGGYDLYLDEMSRMSAISNIMSSNMVQERVKLIQKMSCTSTWCSS